MITDTALVSLFFNYPEDRYPMIYNNALKYFNAKDIHIGRFAGLSADSSYYEKLYRYKIFYLLNFLKEHIQNKYEYMIFVDATDTNFYKDPSTIVDTFLTFKKSIVFNGETELWPVTEPTHLYTEKNRPGPFKYLNSGGYIGYVDSIIKHLTNITEKEYPNRIEDQSAWTIEYLYSEDIDIDSLGKIFFSTHDNKDYVDDNNGTFSLKGLSPYIIHDNGPYNDTTIKFAHTL